MKSGLVLFVLLILVAPVVSAIEIHDKVVVLPIAGHFPGLNGTEWRTDLTIANIQNEALTIQASYYPSQGGGSTIGIFLRAFETRTLDDLILTTFGFDNSSGLIILDSPMPIIARARIYNAGSACGQFGQAAPALPVATLSNRSFIPGLTGVDGFRTNVGVANTQDKQIPVNLTLSTSSGDVLSSIAITLRPYQVAQINNIFSAYGHAPQKDASITITSSDTTAKIYGYASIVRNDSNDAVFVFGTTQQ